MVSIIVIIGALITSIGVSTTSARTYVLLYILKTLRGVIAPVVSDGEL